MEARFDLGDPVVDVRKGIGRPAKVVKAGTWVDSSDTWLYKIEYDDTGKVSFVIDEWLSPFNEWKQSQKVKRQSGLRESISIISMSTMPQQAQSTGLWSQLLGDLKALQAAYQSAHWRASGTSFFGDHLLYQELYDTVSDELDEVAERSLGITGVGEIVEPESLLNIASQSLKTLTIHGELEDMMLDAENKFLQRCSYMIKTMSAAGELTDGTEDLLQGICSSHEKHIYLLSSRVKKEYGV